MPGSGVALQLPNGARTLHAGLGLDLGHDAVDCVRFAEIHQFRRELFSIDDCAIARSTLSAGAVVDGEVEIRFAFLKAILKIAGSYLRREFTIGPLLIESCEEGFVL